jgi:hypothetical protein
MIDITNRNALGVMGSVLGQVAPEPLSYEVVWNRLMDNCSEMIGHNHCVKLLGYRPFVCPVVPTGPTIQIGGRTMTGNPLLWFALGFAGGMLVSRLLK